MAANRFGFGRSLTAARASFSSNLRAASRQLAENVSVLEQTQHRERDAAGGNDALRDVEVMKHELSSGSEGVLLGLFGTLWRRSLGKTKARWQPANWAYRLAEALEVLAVTPLGDSAQCCPQGQFGVQSFYQDPPPHDAPILAQYVEIAQKLEAPVSASYSVSGTVFARLSDASGQTSPPCLMS